MTLKTAEWVTAMSLLVLTGRVIYIYIEWRWRARQIRLNDHWLAQREGERKATRNENNRVPLKVEPVKDVVTGSIGQAQLGDGV